MKAKNSFRNEAARGHRQLSLFLEQLGAAAVSVLLISGPFVLYAFKVI